jgi:LAO/AO transport system kinase
MRRARGIPVGCGGPSDEIEAIALAALRARMGDLRAGHGIAEHAAAVVAGTTDPYAAADDVVAHLA